MDQVVVDFDSQGRRIGRICRRQDAQFMPSVVKMLRQLPQADGGDGVGWRGRWWFVHARWKVLRLVFFMDSCIELGQISLGPLAEQVEDQTVRLRTLKALR